MEREISTGAMLGVMLLTLAAVIGLGFGIFEIAKGIADNGSTQVQQQLNIVSNQVFLDYDQKVVTGTQVLAAVKEFEGKPYAVLIDTTGFSTGQQIASSSVRTSGEAFLVNGVVGPTTNTFIDYNALIANSGDTAPESITAGSTVGGKATGSAPVITMTNGHYIMSNGLYTQNGNIVSDDEFGGLYASGNAEYIDVNSLFQANDIEDTSGNYVGVSFKQLPAN